MREQVGGHEGGDGVDDDWQRWNRYDWSAALLDHYFLRASGRAAAVDFIDASEDSLASCIGAHPSDGTNVREHFLDVIARSAQGGSPWRKVTGQSPDRWFAYLVAACSVFIDSQRADEQAYIEPLRDRLGESFTSSLDELPDLWTQLETWLEENSDAYRPLALPEPGGWSRIGHTVKLAFPPRRDQVRIATYLDAEGISDDPPLGQVVDGLRRMRSDLSAQMQQALTTFETLLASEASPEELYDTALWSAVLSASRATYQPEEAEHGELGILIFEDDEHMAEVFIVGKQLPDTVASSWKPIDGFEPWTDVCQDEAAIAELFQGRGWRGRLARLFSAGFVPLVDNGHWELQPRGESSHPRAALVAAEEVARYEASGNGPTPNPRCRATRLGPCRGSSRPGPSASDRATSSPPSGAPGRCTARAEHLPQRIDGQTDSERQLG